MPFGAVDPALSADGNFVAFWSWDTDGKLQAYVKNLTTGDLEIASSDANGHAGVNNASGTFTGGANTIAISADGSYVAFTSDAVLTADDSGTGADLFVKDMQTGAITRLDLPAGTFASDLSTQLAMRADGQYIAFVTSAALSSTISTRPPISMACHWRRSARRRRSPSMPWRATTGSTRPRSRTSGGHRHLRCHRPDRDALPRRRCSARRGGRSRRHLVHIDRYTSLPDNVYQLRASVTASGATNTDGDLITIDTVAPTVALSADKTHLGRPDRDHHGEFQRRHRRSRRRFPFRHRRNAQRSYFRRRSYGDGDFYAGYRRGFFTIQANPDSAFDFSGNPSVGTNLTIGLAFDGDFSGSFVFADANHNGVFDVGEASTTTDAAGNFVLSGGSGPLILTGGTDISTGLSFTGELEAPEGSAVVTPLTTVVEKLIQTSGDTVSQADNAVIAALGLPASIDLTTLDAVAGAQSGDPAALSVFETGSELLDVITLIQAAGGSADAAYAALAADITADVADGTTIDLTDAAVIETIGQSAGLDSVAAQVVASIASETDAAIKQQLAGTSSPLQAFIDITGASIAEQGDAAAALAQTSGDAGYQQVLNDYLQNLDATLSRDDLTAADNAACYCRGTLVATNRGDVAVEKLQIGDWVVIMSGATRPIKWIGRRSYTGRFILGRKDILPICIKAGALSDNVPRRNLWISPCHAMYFESVHREGVLIEAKDLVNGTSIVQAERPKAVEYYHVELDSHDVIVAEGAFSETFIDDDSRGMFHNAHEFRRIYAEEHVAAPTRYFAPRVDEGYELEAIRGRIAQRARLRSNTERVLSALRGCVDLVSVNCVQGWAQNIDHPEAPVCLDIYARGLLIGQTLANEYRADLEHAGIGSGNHSFAFTAPDGVIFPDAVEVRRSIDGSVLSQSSRARKEVQPSIAA